MEYSNVSPVSPLVRSLTTPLSIRPPEIPVLQRSPSDTHKRKACQPEGTPHKRHRELVQRTLLKKYDEVLTPTQPIPEDEFCRSIPPAHLICPYGTRSFHAQRFIRHLSCALPAPDAPLGVMLTIHQIQYFLVSSKTQGFSRVPLASCGTSATREILLLDPKNCPLLDHHFRKLRKKVIHLQEQIGRPLTNEQVLSVVSRYVNSKIFFAARDANYIKKVDTIFQEALADVAIEKISHSKEPNVLLPAISLERFVKEGVGVCRHGSLTLCYLIERLIHEPYIQPILEGVVQHLRDDTPLGAHSWAVFVPKAKQHEPPQRWMVDPFSGMLENFALPEGRANLACLGDALQKQIKRTHYAAVLCGQPV